MNKAELNRILRQKSVEELSEQLITLFENFEVVSDFFELKYKDSTKASILKKYQKKIDHAIFPEGDWNNGLDLDLVDKLIEEFSKITSDLNLQIGLELYALETGNQCAYDLGGDFGEDYFLYFEELFEQTLNKSRNINLSKSNRTRIENFLKTAFEGYGHKHTLEEIWSEFNKN